MPSSFQSLLSIALKTILAVSIGAVVFLLVQLFILPIIFLAAAGDVDYFTSTEFRYWSLPIALLISLLMIALARSLRKKNNLKPWSKNHLSLLIIGAAVLLSLFALYVFFWYPIQ